MPLNKETLLFFYKDGFGIKWPTKVDMPLSKETETEIIYIYIYIYICCFFSTINSFEYILKTKIFK